MNSSRILEDLKKSRNNSFEFLNIYDGKANVEISREKIHKTYRVQYLQDVCLPAPSLFEENLLSVLNSYIFFSRIDIVTMLQVGKLRDDKIVYSWILERQVPELKIEEILQKLDKIDIVVMPLRSEESKLGITSFQNEYNSPEIRKRKA